MELSALRLKTGLEIPIRDYTVDAVLNIDQLTEQHAAAGPTHLYQYGYDALDQLTSASYPTALGLPSSESFEYDDAGNREIPGQLGDYDYDANHRITASPGKVWVYDDDGNPESTNAGLADEETFTYDFTNRMRGYTNAQTSTTASYLYDPFGRGASPRPSMAPRPGSSGTATTCSLSSMGPVTVTGGTRTPPGSRPWSRRSPPGPEPRTSSRYTQTTSIPLGCSAKRARRSGERPLRPSERRTSMPRARWRSTAGSRGNTGTNRASCTTTYRSYDSSIGGYISADPIGQSLVLLADSRDAQRRFARGLQGIPLVVNANLYGYALNDPANLIDPEGQSVLVIAATPIETALR